MIKLENKHLGVFYEDYLIDITNVEYEYYHKATIHKPIYNHRLSYSLTQIYVHRWFENGNDLYGDSNKVFEGMIKDDEELQKTLKQLCLI